LLAFVGAVPPHPENVAEIRAIVRKLNIFDRINYVSVS